MNPDSTPKGPAAGPDKPPWLTQWMRGQKAFLWGVADLAGFSTPEDDSGKGFPLAISWALPMNPRIMESIQEGPNRTYADEYSRVNDRINHLAARLADRIREKGFRALPLAASERTDTVHIRGEFPHKTAATRAGLGWIGRHCQLVTRPYGPWVRLGTLFTDMEVPPGRPVTRSFCGGCTRCVDRCPAGALTGAEWSPGLARERILDVRACDRWKKENYMQFHNGQNCGICSAVCPYGLKTLERRRP